MVRERLGLIGSMLDEVPELYYSTGADLREWGWATDRMLSQLRRLLAGLGGARLESCRELAEIMSPLHERERVRSLAAQGVAEVKCQLEEMPLAPPR